MIKVECKDHKGNIFSSKQDRAKRYGLSVSTIDGRLQRGWTLEDALTMHKISTGCSKEKELEQINITDHKGNVFPTKKDMCAFYNITITEFNAFIKRGYNKEEALEGKYKDHKGNRFRTFKAMCDFWNIHYETAKTRVNVLNYSLEKALTTPVVDQSVTKIPLYDPITKECTNYSILSKKYNIKSDNIYANIARGYSVAQSVKISIIISRNKISINKIVYNLRIDKRIKKGKDVFECYEINEDGTDSFRIMSQEMIDQYCIEQYKKEKGLM